MTSTGSNELKKSSFPKKTFSSIIPVMKPKSEKSIELYQLMLSRGYPEEFCDLITRNLNTDFTARRMLGYFSHMKHPSPEDVADEMLAILADRNAIMKKRHGSHSGEMEPDYGGRI